MQKIRNLLTIMVLATSSLSLAPAATASEDILVPQLAHSDHRYSYPGERHYYRSKPRYYGHEHGRHGHKHYRHYREHRPYRHGDLRKHHRPYYSRAYRTSDPGHAELPGMLVDLELTLATDARTYRF